MIWSNTTDLNAIVQEITFLTGIDVNAISKKERSRLANRWYHRAAILAWKTDPDWQFDDANIGTSESNQSWTYDATFAGLPRATRDLVDDQRIYRLPTNALSVERVEVMRSDGRYYEVRPIQEHNIRDLAISTFLETKSQPRYYNLVGTNIELLPAPDAGEITLTDGIKIYVSREVEEIGAEDDSVEPSLPEPFHRILSLGASYDIAIAKGLQNVNQLKGELDQLFLEMEGYYASRQRHNKKRIMPARRSYM